MKAHIKLVPVLTNPKHTVVIEMSRVEAESLLALMPSIGGYPDTTRRGDIDAIGQALREAGVGYPAGVKLVGSITFVS